MNLGEYVTRINLLARKLTTDTADSFADKSEIYKLATDIMLEANRIRELMQERDNGKPRILSVLHPFDFGADDLPGEKK
jgi:hypothetical protein